MKLKILEKYIYVYDEDEQVAYYEHFNDLSDRVFKISSLDKKGEKFFKFYRNNILSWDVYKNGRKISADVMFLYGNKAFNNKTFNYIALI
jgi:hypothetical protein